MLFRIAFIALVIAMPWYAEARINEILPDGFYFVIAIYYMIALGALVEGANRGR